MTAKLPGARADLIPGAGPMAPEFYRFFLELMRQQSGNASSTDVSAVNEQIAALQAEINALPDASGPSLRVLPPLILADGVLRLVESQASSASGRSLPQAWVFA